MIVLSASRPEKKGAVLLLSREIYRNHQMESGMSMSSWQ
jgi:hypothetical protein